MRGVFARHALIAAQARHPGVEPGEVAIQRLDLAQPAAELAVLDRFVEEVHALRLDHRFDRGGFREDDLDALVVAIAHAIDQVVGRLRQAARIEHEDARGRIDPVHHVEQHQPFGRAERARERDLRREALERPGEQLLRIERFALTGLDEALDGGVHGHGSVFSGAGAPG